MLIGAREAEAPVERKPVRQQAPQQPQVDLLGGLDTSTPSAAPTPVDDMFSGMSLGGMAPAADPFAQQPLATPAPAQQNAPDSNRSQSSTEPLSEDLFTNMNIANGNGAQSAPGAPPPGQMQTQPPSNGTQPGIMPAPMPPSNGQFQNPGVGMQPGMMQPGLMQPGMMQPGMMQPGMMQPGMMQPGIVQPGMPPIQTGAPLGTFTVARMV